tara:strand:- start:758 stop:1747 length:990 start_codon:yes stop_codon:yes gene_type:complete
MAENNGDPFSLKNYQNLQKGFDRTNPFSSSSGSLTKSNIFGALSTLGSNLVEKASPVGAMLSAGNIYGNIKSEQAAAEAMKTDPKYGATLIGPTIQNMVNMAPSALSLARAEADTDGDGVVTNKESQNFGMSKGLTSYDLGIDMDRPTTNLSRTFSQGAGIGTSSFSSPPAIDTSLNQNPTNPANFTNKDFGTGGPPSGVGNQPQKPDDNNSGDGGLTFICTVLHEKGDMPPSVYKYDKFYGTIVDKNIFDGYALWGRPLARLMKRNEIVYKIAKPIALSWANQMAYDKSNTICGKKSITGTLIKYIGEPLCYAIGFTINRSRKWLKLA